VFSHFIQPIALAGREYIADRSLFAQEVVDAAAERLRQGGLIATPLVIEGSPKQVLIDEAERWGADSIFVGSRGLDGALKRFLLGSVSSAVVSNATCSVEVVR